MAKFGRRVPAAWKQRRAGRGGLGGEQRGVDGRGVAVAWCGAGTSTGFHKGSVAAVVLLQLLIQQGAEPSFLLGQRAEAVALREDD